jgi:hypothetical protein
LVRTGEAVAQLRGVRGAARTHRAPTLLFQKASDDARSLLAAAAAARHAWPLMATQTSPRGLWAWLNCGSDLPTQDSLAVEKTGAGLLLRVDGSGECLLLLRRSTHNDRTWGLPGGNAEDSDGARRAARLWLATTSHVMCTYARLQVPCGRRRCARRRRSWARCRRCGAWAAT